MKKERRPGIAEADLGVLAIEVNAPFFWHIPGLAVMNPDRGGEDPYPETMKSHPVAIIVVFSIMGESW